MNNTNNSQTANYSVEVAGKSIISNYWLDPTTTIGEDRYEYMPAVNVEELPEWLATSEVLGYFDIYQHGEFCNDFIGVMLTNGVIYALATI